MIIPKLFLFLGILASFFIQSWLGGFSGLIFTVSCLLIYFLIDAYFFHQAKQWVQNIEKKAPSSIGPYQKIISPIEQYLDHQKNDDSQNAQLTQNILWAANAFPAAVIILDKNYFIRWSNRQAKQLLNIDLKRDNGRTIFNYIRQADFYDYLTSADWSDPYHCTKERDGRRYHFKFELTQYSQEHILLLCFDNTQLEVLRKTQQDFVANVSHELRTPLTVLIGFLETMRDLPAAAISSEQRQHFEGLMQEQANRMLAIVNDLLTLSTLESTRLEKQQPIVDIQSIIENAKIQVEALSNQEHTFHWHIDPCLRVKGNANELNSAITNLLTNAVRYTPTGGVIEVLWSSNEQGEALFSVKDSGLGIAASDIPRVTERFYRVDKSRSRASGGTGLGLAITKHIAIRHNAKLQIKSKLNEGSTFSLVFPKENITTNL